MKQPLASARFRHSAAFRTISWLMVIAFTVLACNGCVSIKVSTPNLTSDTEAPSIAMMMFLKKPGTEGEVYNGVGSELLYKNATGEFVQVASSLNGQWILKNAPAGTYRIKLAESYEINGEVVKLSGERIKTFTLPSGKRAQIQIILKKTPVGLIVVLSIVIVGLVILAVLAERDVPRLPLVPPGLPGSLVPLPVITPVPLKVFFPVVPVIPDIRPIPPLLPVPVFIDYGVYVPPNRRPQVDEEEEIEVTP